MWYSSRYPSRACHRCSGQLACSRSRRRVEPQAWLHQEHRCPPSRRPADRPTPRPDPGLLVRWSHYAGKAEWLDCACSTGRTRHCTGSRGACGTDSVGSGNRALRAAGQVGFPRSVAGRSMTGSYAPRLGLRPHPPPTAAVARRIHLFGPSRKLRGGAAKGICEEGPAMLMVAGTDGGLQAQRGFCDESAPSHVITRALSPRRPRPSCASGRGLDKGASQGAQVGRLPPSRGTTE